MSPYTGLPTCARSLAQENLGSLMQQVAQLQADLDASESGAVQTAEQLFTAQSDLSSCIKAMNEARAGLQDVVRHLPQESELAETLGSLVTQLEPPVPLPMVRGRPSSSKRNHDAGQAGAAGERKESGAMYLARKSLQDGPIWGGDRSSAEAAEKEALTQRAVGAENKVKELSTRLDSVVAAYREAREELARDEEIFRTKLETIGDLHSRLTEALDQNELLKEAVVEADMKTREYANQVATLQQQQQQQQHQQAPSDGTASSKANEDAEGGSDTRRDDGGRPFSAHSAKHRRNVSFGHVSHTHDDGVGGDSEDGDSMVLYRDAGDLSVLTEADTTISFATPAAPPTGGGDGDGDGAVVAAQAELEELQAQLARAEEANRALEESYHQVEQDKSRLESDLQNTEREHARAKRTMQTNLRDLTLAIRQKEELIRTLAHSENEAALAAQAFEERVHRLEREVVAYRDTVAKVQSELSEHDRAREASTHEAQQAQEAIKRKCVWMLPCA